MSYEKQGVGVTKITTRAARLADRGRRWLLDHGFPSVCIHCGEPLPTANTPAPLAFLCTACRSRLSPSPATACGRCGLPDPLDSDVSGCSACRATAALEARAPEALDGILWGWAYAPPISTAVLSMKFRRLDYLARDLAEATVVHTMGRLPTVDGVAPVPLHWMRRWSRGYDQAELLAVAVARVLDLPLCRVLRRRRHGPAQSGLDEERRRANLHAAFVARRRIDITGRRFLLVDDVITTGATLRSAAQALRNAGAAEVWALAVARTPHESEKPSDLESLQNAESAYSSNLNRT